ncbi:unnamed protein product [Arabidopsis arenosa]|uniref:Uncharacterized protein n=1 Tax=Arabidopsis arenosa TaxID=38785 RepID=A0A8S2A6A5_ARAAE|nr:unnamed protein product [Arabidopsis arenosa]
MDNSRDTEKAQHRSQTYSNASMSDRNVHGPHIHLSGRKSHKQIQEEMEEELERPVSLGEVFIKTHTKPDGMYVDRKTEKIAQTYEKNVQEKFSELENAAREAEHSRAVANQKDKVEHLSLVEKYMRATYLAFLDFMETHSTSATTKPVSNGLRATFPTTTPAAS